MHSLNKGKPSNNKKVWRFIDETKVVYLENKMHSSKDIHVDTYFEKNIEDLDSKYISIFIEGFAQLSQLK